MKYYISCGVVQRTETYLNMYYIMQSRSRPRIRVLKVNIIICSKSKKEQMFLKIYEKQPNFTVEVEWTSDFTSN